MIQDPGPSILAFLLDAAGASPAGWDEAQDWRKQWRDLCARWPLPADRALAGGRVSQGLAGAFAAGYQAAIARLVPDLAPGRLKALCVTEVGGVHPRAIDTRLTPAPGDGGLVVNGAKSFVTGADSAEWLLVACSPGSRADGRNRIVMAAVARRSPGVTLMPRRPLPFVPEISHAAVSFENVALDDTALLPGDGWTDYVKPFRTVEDLHVTAATTGYLIGVGRRWGWPAPAVEEGLALAAALRALSASDPSSPATHLALAGILTLFAHWLERLEPLWPCVEDSVRQCWQRDRPLLAIATEARGRRLDSARKQCFG